MRLLFLLADASSCLVRKLRFLIERHSLDISDAMVVGVRISYSWSSSMSSCWSCITRLRYFFCLNVWKSCRMLNWSLCCLKACYIICLTSFRWHNLSLRMISSKLMAFGMLTLPSLICWWYFRSWLIIILFTCILLLFFALSSSSVGYVCIFSTKYFYGNV